MAGLEESKRKLVLALHGSILHATNHPTKQLECVETLLTIFKNVTESPDEKFRRLKISGNAFKNKVACVRGGEDYLLASGWRRVVHQLEPFYALPEAADAATLQLALSLLSDTLETVKEKKERRERDDWLAKNDDKIRLESTRAQIAADKAARADRAELHAAARAARGSAGAQGGVLMARPGSGGDDGCPGGRPAGGAGDALEGDAAVPQLTCPEAS